MFKGIRYGEKVTVHYLDVHNESATVTGKVSEIFRKKKLIKVTDDEGNKHFFYDWEIEEIQLDDKVSEAAATT